MSEELAEAVAAHVKKEVASVRSKMDETIERKTQEMWEDLNKRYRDRIVVVLSVALALMVGGFALSTITATREANKAVIDFQNNIIGRQKEIIESENRVSIAAGKLTKAEAELAAATTKLDEVRKALEDTTADLDEAKKKYDAFVAAMSKK